MTGFNCRQLSMLRLLDRNFSKMALLRLKGSIRIFSSVVRNFPFLSQDTCVTRSEHSVFYRKPLVKARNLSDDISHPTMQYDDDITRQLCVPQTAVELLDTFGTLEPDSLTPAHTSLITQRLVNNHYQSMCSVHSWLQENIHVAQIQLRLCGDAVLWLFVRPVHQHPKYWEWTNIVRRDCNYYTPDQLANSLLATFYLGVSPESGLLYHLLAETHNRLLEFGFKALATTSNALKSLPGHDFVAYRLMLKQLQLLMDESDTVSGEQLVALTTVVVNTLKFMNSNCIQKLVAWLQNIMYKNSNLLTDPENLGAFLRMCQKLSLHPLVEKRVMLEFIDMGVDACYQCVGQLTASNIAEICHSLKVSRRYERDLAMLASERANELLNDGCRLCDVSNLMYALTPESSPSTRLHFTGALHTRLMRSEDVDIVILSNIADVLIDLPNVGSNLLELFQRRVVDRTDEIVSYVTRYHKIVKLLVRKRFVDRELESRFIERLLAHLERNDGVNMHIVSSVASYLLPASRGALPPVFFERLLAAVPRWREPELYRLAIGVNAVRQPLTATMRRQMAQIHSALHANIGARLDTVDSLNYLYQLTLGWVIHNRYRDPTLTDRLMSMYTRYSKNLADSVSAVKIAQMFHGVVYYLPSVYDDLVQFLVKTAGSDDDNLVIWVVAACAKVGYQPQMGEDLLRLAGIVYRKLVAQRNYRTALQVLLDLVIIQLYPENELSLLFTLEAIEDLERFMADNPQHLKVLERLTMELNRGVVLECPQLDIPWFHEQYCSENASKDGEEVVNANTVNFKLRNEVFDIISEILGGSKYVQRGTYSPYYYEIDFECLLNEKQRPVDVKHWQHALKKQTCQKIAVCVLPESSYCYNSKQLVGLRQMQKRHLEIMDYKFVEIPYFDWFSMGLTDQQSKYDYIETKLMR